MKGLIHIYTGNGKGKTTTAVGLGIRAYGRGFKVLMIQFLKGGETGEMKVLQGLAPGFELRRGKEVKKFTWNMNETELKETAENTAALFSVAVDAAMGGGWDILILDEIMGAVSNKFIKVEDICSFLNSKPEKLEVVMTGRNAPDKLIELADYVSEIKPLKHPFEKGIPARIGIES